MDAFIDEFVMKESVNPVNQGISEENESEAAKNNT
jgi:hypothetical protein